MSTMSELHARSGDDNDFYRAADFMALDPDVRAEIDAQADRDRNALIAASPDADAISAGHLQLWLVFQLERFADALLKLSMAVQKRADSLNPYCF